MIFNHSVRINIIRTSGSKVFHYFKYRGIGTTGYELGVNIIPKRFGILFYMWIDNNDKLLKKRIQEQKELIDDLKETLFMLMGGEHDEEM